MIPERICKTIIQIMKLDKLSKIHLGKLKYVCSVSEVEFVTKGTSNIFGFI